MALKLEKWIGQPNIADEFDHDYLSNLGAQVVRDWEIDLSSRSAWEKKTQDGLDLAMQLAELKTWPWHGAANIKYPLIAHAAIQFHARAYPEIVRGNDVVKGKVIGHDPEGVKQARADRISKHMSYQCTEEMEEWEPDTDRMLLMLPVIGHMFKKTYFDRLRQRNYSCLRKPLDIVVSQSAKSIDDARRITDQGVWLYRNDIYERVQDEQFSDITISYEHDEEKQEAEQFLEQHLWLDLDKDGYQEPYVVTVHRHSAQVVRIVARYDETTVSVKAGKVLRIVPVQYFTDFIFLPSFDGTYYGMGFGQLLLALNEAINTVTNQLLDSGTLANVQGGLVSKGIKIKGGQYRFSPGEWKQTDASAEELSKGFFPLPVREPSAVLFQMLSFLVDAGKQLSSVADIMSGEQAGPNEPVGTMLARIEQGMKVFNGIHKRIFRSLKSEYKKLAALNAKYLDDEVYYRVMDKEQIAARQDYNTEDVDVVPVSDPSQGTDVQRMARAQALMPLVGTPGVDAWEVVHRYIQAIGVDDIDKLHPEEGKEAAGQQPPDPKMLELQAKMELEQVKLERQAVLDAAQIQEIEAKIDNTRADTVLKLAQAEAAELGPQLEYYKTQAEQLQQEAEAQRAAKEGSGDSGSGVDGGGVQGMEEQPFDGEGIQGPAPVPAELGAEIPPAGLDGADLSGGGIPGGGAGGGGLPVGDGGGGLGV